jgi:hypothetical protein
MRWLALRRCDVLMLRDPIAAVADKLGYTLPARALHLLRFLNRLAG